MECTEGLYLGMLCGFLHANHLHAICDSSEARVARTYPLRLGAPLTLLTPYPCKSLPQTL